MAVTFSKGLKVLEFLLDGKTPKQAMSLADVSYSEITQVKSMFPLFLGLPRAYKKAQESGESGDVG